MWLETNFELHTTSLIAARRMEDSLLSRTKCFPFVDIEGSKTPAGGTMPPEAVVAKKPDLVIIDRKKNPLSLY